MLKEFFRSERGMAPYSILGISMLLIVGVAIYHFNNVDIQKAQERNELTFDMETFYSTVKVGQDLQQVVRVSAEKSVLASSMSTYGEPIQVNSEWGNQSEFNQWKNKAANDMAEQAEKEIFDFYHGGDEEALEKQYYNPSTNFDFSNFIKTDGIEITVVQDNYDDSTKTQKSLEFNVDFKDGGAVSAKNKFTGYEISMSTGTNVSVDSRPFTMADKAYDFTEKFNNQDKANELAWTMWGVQTVLGLMEANVKRDVRFATDDRVSYSLMHLIVAYEELETFGTFDYVHTTIEFLRPWIGAEGEATEFLSLLSLSMDESNVDEAIASMESAAFVSDVAKKTQEISNSMITASSYLDSKTVTIGGLGFNSSEVAKAKLSGEGTVQHLEKAENTLKLNDILRGIDTTKNLAAGAKEYVESGTVNMLSVSAHFKPLGDEYSEVRTEWEQADDDLKRSRGEIISTRNGYSSLNSTLNGKICDNPIAAMLWFGDTNQNVKGFKDILTTKHRETTELLNYYGELEKKIGSLDYEAVKDSYDIDKHYSGSSSSLKEAETSIRSARTSRNEYLDQKYKHDNCYRHVDWKDPQMGSCLGSGKRCNPYTCNPHDCNCETDEDGEESCDTCWDTCWHTCYDCICDKAVLRDNYENAENEYKESMESVENNLETASTEVTALQTQISSFFTDKGISGAYSLIDYPIIFSIYDGYYYHWNYTKCEDEEPFPGKRYNCAKSLVPDPSPVVGTNYENMPKSPLTYDTAHEDYSNYGLYYIKYMIDKMNETFGGSSINAGELAKGKEKLEDMKESGFFAKINAILKPIRELVNAAGDIKSAIAKIKNIDTEFPNSKEHFYTTLPLPPFNGSKIGFENQGFSVIHDIRFRADTRPGVITLPIIGPVTLGNDGGINPSLPIPYTPISVYLWQFDITSSKVGKEDNIDESSTLWLMDTESSQIAPLMEMGIGPENFDVPLYLHKPTMYKYEFTPDATIGKGLDRLPPVFILALGPFKTNFGPYMEPPDKKLTHKPMPVEVSFDREFTNDSVKMTVSTKENNVYIETYITETVSLDNEFITTEYNQEFEKTFSVGELELLGKYGWSVVKADTYTAENEFDYSILKNIQGEDHARVYFIDPNLESIEVRLEKNGSNLKVINNGNRKIDVSIEQKTGDSCLFIFNNGNMSKNWIGSVEPGSPVDLSVAPENNVIITAEVLIPEKLEKELENRAIPLTLKAQT